MENFKIGGRFWWFKIHSQKFGRREAILIGVGREIASNAPMVATALDSQEMAT